MSNTEAGAADTFGSSTDYYNLRKAKSASFHKALDFSNVGMPYSTTSDNRSLRQFHQTRLYISGFSGMQHHGTTLGGGDITYLISANLPEQFSYKIGSKWEAPLSDFGGAKFNAMMQVVGNTTNTNLASGINRVSTLKIWGGSEPLSLQLKIPVLDDGYSADNTTNGVNTNLVEALEFLGSLCLPAEEGALGFYVPPPSPLSYSIGYTGTNDQGQAQYKGITFAPTSGRIMLQLGGMLLVDNCLIEGISVEYPNTKALIKHTYDSNYATGRGTSYLHPLLAEVTINITTIEALTSNTYSKMLWLKHQSDQGKGTTNFTEIIDGAADQLSAAGSWVANTVNSLIGGSSDNNPQ